MADNFNCECDNQDHQNTTKYERYGKLIMHMDITTKMAPFSKTIPIIVGPAHHTFHLQKDLLALHSRFFKNKISDLELVDEANQRIMLPKIDASGFAEFACWLHSYSFAPIDNDVLHGEVHLLGERLWQLGSVLQAPGFQNFAMDDALRYCQNGDYEWPVCGEVAAIYQLTAPGSKLRLFAAHSVFCKCPDESHKDYEAWEKFLTDNDELGEDISCAETRKKDWKGTMPWDDENRHLYMEEETPSDQACEAQILEKRSLRQIREAVVGRCPKSVFELAHLQRNDVKKGKMKE